MAGPSPLRHVYGHPHTDAPVHRTVTSATIFLFFLDRYDLVPSSLNLDPIRVGLRSATGEQQRALWPLIQKEFPKVLRVKNLFTETEPGNLSQSKLRYILINVVYESDMTYESLSWKQQLRKARPPHKPTHAHTHTHMRAHTGVHTTTDVFVTRCFSTHCHSGVFSVWTLAGGDGSKISTARARQHV